MTTRSNLVYIAFALCFSACASQAPRDTSPNVQREPSSAQQSTICLKAYSSAETQSALQSCEGLRINLEGRNIGPLNILSGTCGPNARGVAKGFVSENCAVYDAVYSFTYVMSESASGHCQSNETVRARGVASSYHCYPADNGKFYPYRMPGRTLIGGSQSGAGYLDHDECESSLPGPTATADCVAADNGKYYQTDLATNKILGSSSSRAGYRDLGECRSNNK